MVTHPNSGINQPADLKGKTFAFGDKGSTSGYLIPLHYLMTQGIDPERYFSKALATDKVFVTRLQAALSEVGEALKTEPRLLPPHYSGFVSRDNSFYKPIRDAGLATGILQAK